jgi:hypothetical protein
VSSRYFTGVSAGGASRVWKFATVELFQQIVGQRSVEVVRDPNPTTIKSQGTDFVLLRLDGDQAGHGDSGAGDGDFFSGGDALQEAGQVGLGYVDVDFHVAID